MSSLTPGLPGGFVESEVLSAASVSLVNGEAKDVTSVSLPPGIWEVTGYVQFNPGGSALVTYLQGWLSSVSNTQPSGTNKGGNNVTLNTVGSGLQGLPLSPKRFVLTTTTTVYMGALSLFTLDTQKAFGYMSARQVG